MKVISPLKHFYVSVPLCFSSIKPIFCGRPHMYLFVAERNGKIIATLGIGDEDDFDTYLIFKNTTKEFVHELINYMNDVKYAQVLDLHDINRLVFQNVGE